MVARAVNGERSTALVGGQAGIGKTSLVRAAAELAAVRGARVAWGTCVEGAGAPGYWPWTQALNGLARAVGLASSRELAGEDASLLATVATALGRADSGVSDQAPLLLMDATTRWLDALAADGPVMIVLDDLQWADESSLALLDFLVGSPQTGAICIVAAYRDDELSAVARERVSRLLAHADHVHVDGLDVVAVQTLVERVVGAAASAGSRGAPSADANASPPAVVAGHQSSHDSGVSYTPTARTCAGCRCASASATLPP
ncbi:hypothetical protein BH18ACT2_BH18ACT2_09430 [soil metagenome]